MKTSNTLSIRVDVCELATLMRELLDSGLLSKDAAHGAPNNFCTNRAINVAIQACCDSVPIDRQFVDHREAWRWLVDNGVVVGDFGKSNLSHADVFAPNLHKRLGQIERATTKVDENGPKSIISDIVGRLDGKLLKAVDSDQLGPQERT